MVVGLLFLIAIILLFGASRVIGALSGLLAFLGLVLGLTAVIFVVFMTFDLDPSEITFADVAPYLIGLVAVLGIVAAFLPSPPKK